MPAVTARFLSVIVLLTVLCPAAAYAGADFRKQANEEMRLSFDLDAVEGMLMEASQQAPYTSAQPALPLEPNSDVAEVTVFRDRALVTRVLGEKVGAGPGAVTFEGLPLSIATESLHAFVQKGQARIIGVELESGRGEVEETDQTEVLREDMLRITEELGQVRDRIESLLAQRAYLRETLLGGPREGGQPSLDQIRGTLGYVGEAERDIAAQLRSEQDRARDLDEELQPLMIKLNNPLATGMRVRVDVDADQAGPVTVGLRYQVFGAQWRPAYNARLDDGASQVLLEYYGIVSQSTGEDWADVALMLSTADPSVSGALPQLTSWYLGRDTYGYDYNVEGNLMAGRGYYEDGHNPMQAVQQNADMGGMVDSQMNASVQGTGAVVFAIPGQRTIAGDGSEQRLPVGNQTFDVTMERSTVPKLVPEVYRQARLRYAGEAPLLPGTVSTFVGADYVGSGQQKTVVPGEEFLLAFGTDDRMRVERQLVSRQQDYLGVGKKTVRWTFHFRIKLSNFSDETRVLRLVDQLPVSELDRVTVKLLDSTPALEPSPDDGPGLMKWKLTIPPGSEQTVDLRFSVTAPTDVYLGSLTF
jgi:uncharacterized protein (TIGR02231 family)